MKIYMRSRVMVKPAEATWNGYLSISELDQIAGNYHVPLIYMYKPKASQDSNIFEAFRRSLSKVLVGFYPLAGRLNYIGGGRHEIDCNSAGVPLIETKAEGSMEELTEKDYSSYKLVPCMDLITNRNSQKLPLAAVQFTTFDCGGFCLGITICHLAADGKGASNFFAEWSAIARGEMSNNVQPLISRKVLCAAQGVGVVRQPRRPAEFEKPPALIGGHNKAVKKLTTTGAYLTLSKSQVEILKRSANKGHVGPNYYFSRFESIAAHVWRCTCKARKHSSDQRTRLTTSVDIRQRSQPPLPKTYFGNAVLDVVAQDYAGDLISNPLSYAATRIREAINKVTPEYIEETISFLRDIKDLSSHVYNSNIISSSDNNDDDEGGFSFHGNPNLSVTSWLSLPFQGLDFGWGNDIYMTTLAKTWDGDVVVLPGDSEGSVVVVICLQQIHMEAFKMFFYQDQIETTNNAL